MPQNAVFMATSKTAHYEAISFPVQGGTMIDKENDEEGVQVEECAICGGDIIIDGFCEEDDMVYCNDCEA